MDELQRSQAHWPVLLNRLQQRLSYRFVQAQRLEEALTHRSFGQPHSERLEFLGDAVVNLVVAQWVFERFPGLDEGGLSRIRASLVCKATLTDIALSLDLGEYLRVGAGEKRSRSPSRSSLLADTLEACIGAVYLDGGLAAARQLIHLIMSDRLMQIDPGALIKDHKTRLQEQLQRQKLTIPTYTILARHGEDHEQEFEVRCDVHALSLQAVGRGPNKRQAEQAAAAKLLEAWQIRGQR